MSLNLLSACWRIQKISPTQKLVLISLADQSNDNGVCWPSVSHIQERTCLSERAIRSAISQLSELGLLSKTERTGRSTYYTITPAPAAPLHEAHPTPAPAAPLHEAHPTPAPAAPPPLHEAHPTPAPAAPITVIESSLEPSSEYITTKLAKAVAVKKPAASLSKTDLVKIGFDEQLAEDYLTLRKAKKLPLTKTALINVVREGAECGLNPNQTLNHCITSSWAGFKKDWYLKDNAQGKKVSVISDFLKDPDFDF